LAKVTSALTLFARAIAIRRFVARVSRLTYLKIAFKSSTSIQSRRPSACLCRKRKKRYGTRLYELSRGVDRSEVVPDRPTKSISAEDTFEHDVPLAETEVMIRRLAEKLWSASRKESRIARTVVLKLKTSEFKILTRSHTPSATPSSCEELTAIALALRGRVHQGIP